MSTHTFRTIKELEQEYPQLAELVRKHVPDLLGVGEFIVYPTREDLINYILEREVPEIGTLNDCTLPNNPLIPNPMRWVHINDYFEELVKGWEDSGMVVDEANGQACHPISTLLVY